MQQKGLISSYKFAQLVAQRKNTLTFSECIIAPALSIITTMLGKEATEKVQNAPVSNDTI